MRIVEDAPKEFRATCFRCGAVFAYVLKDIWHNNIRCCDGVSCPSCGDFHRHPYQGVKW